MARINLLPWREELRAERQKNFFTALIIVAVAGIFAVLGVDQIIGGQIDAQGRRNAYLQQNIAELDRRVEEIRNLQRQRSQLIERMRIIQELQGNRPIIVRVMDQLVRTVPDGVFYTSLVAQVGSISLEGVAESNNRVSSLMRRLDASDWLDEPNLDAVRSAPDFGEQATKFNLTVNIQLPAKDEEG